MRWRNHLIRSLLKYLTKISVDVFKSFTDVVKSLMERCNGSTAAWTAAVTTRSNSSDVDTTSATFSDLVTSSITTSELDMVLATKFISKLPRK